MDHIKTLAVQVVEHHTVSAIGIAKGLFVLDPRSCDLAGGRLRHTHGVTTGTER